LRHGRNLHPGLCQEYARNGAIFELRAGL
jgi:hypothetical protein